VTLEFIKLMSHKELRQVQFLSKKVCLQVS